MHFRGWAFKKGVSTKGLFFLSRSRPSQETGLEALFYQFLKKRAE